MDGPRLTAVRHSIVLTLHDVRYRRFEQHAVPADTPLAAWVETRMEALRAGLQDHSPEEADKWSECFAEFCCADFPGPHDIAAYESDGSSDEDAGEGDSE